MVQRTRGSFTTALRGEARIFFARINIYPSYDNFRARVFIVFIFGRFTVCTLVGK